MRRRVRGPLWAALFFSWLLLFRLNWRGYSMTEEFGKRHIIRNVPLFCKTFQPPPTTNYSPPLFIAESINKLLFKTNYNNKVTLYITHTHCRGRRVGHGRVRGVVLEDVPLGTVEVKTKTNKWKYNHRRVLFIYIKHNCAGSKKEQPGGGVRTRMRDTDSTPRRSPPRF